MIPPKSAADCRASASVPLGLGFWRVGSRILQGWQGSEIGWVRWAVAKGVEDVNAAAGEYDQYKREELSRDTSTEDEQPIEDEFARIREFCLDSANANCFLIDKDAQPNLSNRVEELTDLRLVHKVRSRVTISGRPGKLFEAYMLDVSQYTASRKKRELEIIEFWRENSTERLRRVGLIYPPAMLSAGR